MDYYDFSMDFVGGNEPPPSCEEILHEIGSKYVIVFLMALSITMFNHLIRES